MKLLVVEDDEALAVVLRKSLSECHYQIDLAADGQAGWDLIEAFPYDLILLDWMLPHLDGLSFCKQLRAKGDLTPILLMTANEAQSSKIQGLDSGADDYLVKPFDLEELLARVRALLRRGKDVVTPQLVWGDVCLEPQSCEVSCCGVPLHLTVKEYGMLELFLRHPQRIFNVGALLDSLWDFEDTPSDNAVRAHIKTLRRKLRDAGVEEMLETIYGLGYRLNPPPPATWEPEPLPTAAVQVYSQAQPQSQAHSQTRSQAYSEPPVMALSPLSVTEQGVAEQGATEQGATEKGQIAFYEVWAVARQQYLNKIEQLKNLILSERVAGDVASKTGLGEIVADPSISSEPLLEQIRRLLHSLKGGLGTFGLTEASAIAAQAQALLPSQPEAKLPHDLNSKVTAIQILLEEAATPCISLQPPAQATAKHCWLLTQDKALWQRLEAEAKTWDIVLQQVRSWQALSQASNPAQDPHLAIILDLKTLALSTNSGASAGANSGTHSISSTVLPTQLPWIGLTNSTDLAEQVQAARLGCKRCLPRGEAPFQVLSVAAELMQGRVQSTGAKILVVDDDRNLLRWLHRLLVPWGFRLTLLQDPNAFLQTLETATPDLVILDYEMPQFTGLDLCQVVRSSPQWQELPILFLSAHQDPETLKSVFEAGADDYVSKPVNEPELIQRVLNRLERTRLLQRLADTDSLTGLSNRRKSLQELNRLLALAKRQQKPLSFVELDIDHFKRINDEHGHAVGDRILQQLGKHLRRIFRGEDVTARWGGEEFILAFYGASQGEAIARLTSLLHSLQQQGLNVSVTQTLPISFSAGVAEYPQHGQTCEQLYRAADQALYQAKAAGRSRIFSYTEGASDAPSPHPFPNPPDDPNDANVSNGSDDLSAAMTQTHDGR